MPETNYLKKQAFYPQAIFSSPNEDLGIVVVIPSYNEPELLHSLKSLRDCEEPDCSTEVIIVINHSKKSDPEIKTASERTVNQCLDWIKENENKKIRFFIIPAFDLPDKIAGVGLARKIGMDEAVRRFERIGNRRGVISCFDADSTCDQNYLVEIEKHFRYNPKTPASSIYFEHPLQGDKYSPEVYEGIKNYELHLRYHLRGLRFAGFPYAFHAIGSSMAVRANIYQQEGGMNKRKAGEDFYFLQKIIPLGNFTEINTTRVIPSPRPSDRVPFGTGKAINKWLEDDKIEFYTYDPETYKLLKEIIDIPGKYYANPFEIREYSFCSHPVLQFLKEVNFDDKMQEILRNSSDEYYFIKRFFDWFNGFMCLRFCHFIRDNYYKLSEITHSAKEFLKVINNSSREESFEKVNLLLHYRKSDQNIH